MVSSVREKIYEVEKQKKIQRRISKQIDDDMKSSFISVDSFNNKNQKDEVTNAVEERQEPENNKQEHQETEVRKVSTKTSSSDSTVKSREVSLEEVIVAEEKVIFKLPKELN